jgi:hypothetical protein
VVLIVKCFQAKVKLTAPKAEHLLCLTLSKKEAKDVVVVGYDLYYSVLNAYGQVDVRCLDAIMGK